MKKKEQAIILTGITSLLILGEFIKKKARTYRELFYKEQEFFQLMQHWFAAKQQGNSIVQYFEKYNFNSIAIYGMGALGEILLNELRDTDIKVVYGIDKNASCITRDIEMKGIGEIVSGVDAIVVTPVSYFDSIEKVQKARVSCPILSLADILCEL